jgi:hypothetical protein
MRCEDGDGAALRCLREEGARVVQGSLSHDEEIARQNAT